MAILDSIDSPLGRILLLLALGSTCTVIVAALVERFVIRGRHRQLVWQVATVALLSLLVIEVSGTSSAAALTLRHWWSGAGELRGEVSAERDRPAVNEERTGRIAELDTRAAPSASPPLLIARGPASADEPDVSGLSRTELRWESLVEGRSAGWSEGTARFPGSARASEFEVPLGSTDLEIPPWVPHESVASIKLRSLDVDVVGSNQGDAVSPGSRDRDQDSAHVGSGSGGLSIRPGITRMAWLLGWGWALGALLGVARCAYGRWLLRRFVMQRTRPASDAMRRQVSEAARRLWGERPRRRVRVLRAEGLPGPVAFGCWCPTIVLPESWPDEFNEAECQAMLLHELAHLAAADAWWQVATDLLVCAYWWQPLAWYARGRSRAASEVAADEATLLLPAGPDLLAECLVRLGRRMQETSPHAAPRLSWHAVGGPATGRFRPRSALARRVATLLNLQHTASADAAQGAQRYRSSGLAWWRGVALRLAAPLALVVCFTTCTAWAFPQASDSLVKGTTTMKIFQSNWSRSLAAAALLAVAAPFATADDDEGERSESPEARAEIREREEGERNERREREELEEREERERGEVREREERERGEIRERERERGEIREREERERGEIREREGRGREGEAERRESRERFELLFRRLGDESEVQRRANLERVAQFLRHRLERGAEGEMGERLRQQLAMVERELAGGREHEGDREGQDIERRIRQLEGEAEELARGGRGEEAEQRVREIHELRRHLERLHAENRRRHEGERGHEGGELERRVHHLRVAAENLHAAGFHDQAEELMRRAEQMAEWRERGEHREPGEHAEREEGRRVRVELHRVQGGGQQDLQREVEQLRRDLNEMREFIGRLARERNEEVEIEVERERERDERERDDDDDREDGDDREDEDDDDDDREEGDDD